MNDTPTPAKPALVKVITAPSGPLIDQTRLAEVIAKLDGVTNKIIQRYGIHPESDATEAAAVFLRELVKE